MPDNWYRLHIIFILSHPKSVTNRFVDFVSINWRLRWTRLEGSSRLRCYLSSILCYVLIVMLIFYSFIFCVVKRAKKKKHKNQKKKSEKSKNPKKKSYHIYCGIFSFAFVLLMWMYVRIAVSLFLKVTQTVACILEVTWTGRDPSILT